MTSAIIALALIVQTAGLSVGIDNPAEVYVDVASALVIWADDPVGICTGAPGNACCVAPATDQQCKDLAIEATNSEDLWTRRMFSCLSRNPNWKAQLFKNARGQWELLRETSGAPTPAETVADVAECASAKAALR